MKMEMKTGIRKKFFTSSFVIRHSSFIGLFPPLPTAVCRLLLVFLALALLGSCQSGLSSDMQTRDDLEPVDNNAARLNLFLNLTKPIGPGIRFEVTTFEVLVDHVWLPLTIKPLTLDSEKIAASQLFIGGQRVMPGRYEGLRFSVTQSSLRRGNGKYESISTEPYLVTLDLPASLQLLKTDSQSLFITWDVQGSLENTDSLRPAMTIAPPLRQFLVDLVYVACPDIDTIFVIRTDKNWVADSFGITGQPTYLALDPDPSSQRLYVLATREARIKTVELNSQRVINSFNIPFADSPSFMTISPDGLLVYVLDGRDNYLSSLDLATGTLLARVHLGYRPQYATFLGNRNLLAVSSVISQTVSLHNPLSLSQVASISTGDSPDGLLASDKTLYIAESGANTVSILDITSDIIQGRIAVGFRPRRLMNINRQIYVSNYDTGSLSIIYPGQLGVGREIPGLGQPLEMVFDETNRWIYAGDDQKAGLAVIDYTTNQLKGYINFGARPLGLVIIQ